MKSVQGTAPLTRRRKKMEQENEKEAKRRLTQFIPGNVIGVNDILVDQCFGKIKLESTVKTEIEETDKDISEKSNITSFDAESDYTIVVVKEEIDLSVENTWPSKNSVDANQFYCVTETVTDDFDPFQIRKVEDGITKFKTENSFNDYAHDPASVDILVSNDVRPDTKGYRVTENGLSPLSSPVNANFEIATRELLASNCCKISKHNSKQKQPAKNEEALRIENQLLGKENEALKLTITGLENKCLELSKKFEKEYQNAKKASELHGQPMENVKNFGNLQSAIQNINLPPKHLDGTVSGQTETGLDIAVSDHRLIFLFPEVAQIIWKKYNFSSMSQMDFLNARRVCTTWGIGIYKIDQGPCTSLRKKRAVHLNISTYQKLSESLQELQNQGILLKTDLTISITNLKRLFVNEVEECITAINDFLTDYGYCIQKFTFDIEKCNRLDWYSTFVHWLKLMPYLEEISAYMNNSFSSYFMANRSSYDESEFPELKCLKHFRVSNWPAVMLAWTLRANRSIITLNLQKMHDNLSKEIIEEVSMPKIQELTIEMKSKKHNLFLSTFDADGLETLRLTLSDFDSFPIISTLRKLVLTLKIGRNSAYHKQLLPLLFRLKDLHEFEIREVHDCNRKNCDLIKRFQYLTPCNYYRTHIVDKLWDHFPTLCKVAIAPCHSARDKTCVFIRNSNKN